MRGKKGAGDAGLEGLLGSFIMEEVACVNVLRFRELGGGGGGTIPMVQERRGYGRVQHRTVVGVGGDKGKRNFVWKVHHNNVG
ncbi:hypothetical protein E2542_SST18245 [Spatholobus suberectus]|nr:hypothetical protein E2542_SST18245 [Spatholobus suberectus]